MPIDCKILGPQSWREYHTFWWEGIKWRWELRKARKLIDGINWDNDKEGSQDG